MNQERLRELALEIINKDKWWDILSRFINVLRINIFMVDAQGLIILPPEEGKYGGRLLTDKSMGFDLIHNSEGLLQQFEDQGNFLESENRYNLYNYAIPIKTKEDQTLAYMIIGPVILNRRLESSRYEQLAQEYGVSSDKLFDEINEIRVVSNVMMNSILELLAEIVRDNIELSIKERELDRMKLSQDPLPKKLSDFAQEIYSSVRLDELLVTLLDVALNMTKAECGSIMVVDEKKGDLTIKVSRGLNKRRIQETHLKMGEGISGLAAQENSSFIIKGQEGDNRIAHLLKRPEIKQALVMPLVAKNRVFGVLNIHTLNEHNRIENNFDNLQYLSKLLSSAF